MHASGLADPCVDNGTGMAGKIWHRLICFVDDFGVLCKPWQRERMVRFILNEFKAHVLLVQEKKCDITGNAKKLLGIGIDIPRM